MIFQNIKILTIWEKRLLRLWLTLFLPIALILIPIGMERHAALEEAEFQLSRIKALPEENIEANTQVEHSELVGRNSNNGITKEKANIVLIENFSDVKLKQKKKDVLEELVAKKYNDAHFHIRFAGGTVHILILFMGYFILCIPIGYLILKSIFIVCYRVIKVIFLWIWGSDEKAKTTVPINDFFSFQVDSMFNPPKLITTSSNNKFQKVFKFFIVLIASIFIGGANLLLVAFLQSFFQKHGMVEPHLIFNSYFKVNALFSIGVFMYFYGVAFINTKMKSYGSKAISIYFIIPMLGYFISFFR